MIARGRSEGFTIRMSQTSRFNPALSSIGFSPSETAAGKTHRRARLEDVHALGAERVLVLTDGRQVVEDPEGTSLRRDDQVSLLDRQVRDGDDGQVELEGLPGGAVVEGDIEAELGPGIEEPVPLRVLPDHAREGALGNSADDLRPGL